MGPKHMNCLTICCLQLQTRTQNPADVASFGAIFWQQKFFLFFLPLIKHLIKYTHIIIEHDASSFLSFLQQ